MKAYHTAGCIGSLGLAPQLIPPALDVVHPVQDDDAVAGQDALCPGVRDAAGFFLGAGMVIDVARMRSVMRGNDLHLESRFQRGRAGRKELIL